MSLDVKKKLGNIVRRVIRHGVVGVDRLTTEEDEPEATPSADADGEEGGDE